jgi:hypothetical protein
MAEKTIVVCDVCGRPATEVVTIKTSRGNFVKDLCAQHVSELTAGARKPRPGRPRKIGGSSSAAAGRGGRPRMPAANGRKKKSVGRPTRRSRRKAQTSSS